MHAHDTIGQHVKAASIMFPELSLSFGYIGNVYRDGHDDRSWRVFTNRMTHQFHPVTGAYQMFGGQEVAFGYHGTEGLPRMLEAIERGELIKFCERASTMERRF